MLKGIQMRLDAIESAKRRGTTITDASDDKEGETQEIQVEEIVYKFEYRILKAIAKMGSKSKLDTLCYGGSLSLEELMDWITEMDYCFDYESIEVPKKVKFACTKLKGHASLWLDHVQLKRERSGKDSIKSWDRMVTKLKDLELPLYKIKKRLFANLRSVRIESSCHVHENQNDLDMLLLAQWEDRASKGLLKYDVTACETKIIPGSYGFITQLNAERHLKKQPIECQAKQVLQPFDPSKFNFTKVGQDELLFCIKMSEDESCELIPKASVRNGDNLIIINVRPTEYGHVLLVPRAFCCLPQMIDVNSLELAINMAAAVNNCFFRIGYNSLGAFATVNHLHFQAYYLANPLPVEVAGTQFIPGDWQKSGLRIFEIVDYPVKGLLFEVGQNFGKMAEVVATFCCSLQNKNMPFNLLISDCGARIFLFPQCFADRHARGMIEEDFLQTKVNPAVWEIGGHVVFNRNLDYDQATEQFVRDLLAVASLNHEDFEGVKRLCTHIAETICCQY